MEVGDVDLGDFNKQARVETRSTQQFILGECVRGEGQGPQKEPAWEVGLSSPEHIPESKKKASLLGRDGAWVLGFTPQDCGVQSTCLPLPRSLPTRIRHGTGKVKWGECSEPSRRGVTGVRKSLQTLTFFRGESAS